MRMGASEAPTNEKNNVLSTVISNEKSPSALALLLLFHSSDVESSYT
jgi:hypothetical protein